MDHAGRKRQLIMKIIYSLAGIIFIVTIFNSCYYDKFDEIHPLDGYRDPCDSTADTTYTQSIRYIMAYNCTSCHSSYNAQGNVQLDTYDGVVTEAKNGKLWGVVNHSSGYKPMPPGIQIPDCQLQRIYAWKDSVPQ